MSKQINVNTASHRRSRGIRKYLANLFLGLCIIAVGIGYLGNYVEALPWSDFTLFFPGWGALFLIIPAVYYLIRNPFSWFWPVCLLIGVLILIAKLEIYPIGQAVAIGLAVLVILVGLRVILSPIFKRLRRKKLRRIVSDSGINFDGGTTFVDCDGSYNVKFGERSIVFDGQDFTSATLNVSFGEMKFDLTNAVVTDCAVIDANCSFGDLTILLPDHVRAEVTRRGSFSDITCRHKDPKDEAAPVVYVNANCSFGDFTIK